MIPKLETFRTKIGEVTSAQSSAILPSKMVTKFEGLGARSDVILVAKVCLSSVTFGEFLPLRRINDV